MNSGFSERNIGLDVMRSFAILSVLIWHSTGHFRLLGLIGVEMFFVLSGFLIGGIIIRDFKKFNGINTIVNFWKRRWYRTLPAYYFFLIINIIFSFLKTKEKINFLSYVFFLQNFAWPMQNFFGQSWSLSIEEWFYLLIPILIGTGINYRMKPKKAIVLAVITLGSLSIFGRYIFSAIFENANWYYGIRKITILRFDSMMAGVTLAILKVYNNAIYAKIKNRRFLLIGIFLLSTIYFGMKYEIWNLNALSKTLVFLICSLSFAFILPTLEDIKIENYKIKAIFFKISIWSYSLYLCNNETIRFSQNISNRFFENHGRLAFLISIPLGLLFSLIVARCSYEWIEKPFLKLRDKKTIS